VAITVHLEHQGEPISMLLDVVEVAKSHTGVNLAAAFAKILEDYGISDKVKISAEYQEKKTYLLTRFWELPAITLQQMMQWSRAWLKLWLIFLERPIVRDASPTSLT
jgi:hypothetical protein